VVPSLGPPNSASQTASRSVSRLCTAHCRRSLYFAMSRLPQKLPFSMGRSEPPSNTWFPGPTRVLNPNGISISSAVSAQLTSVTDRLTDHTTQSVTVGRIYVCSTATQPNTSAPSGYNAVPEAMHEWQLCVLRVQSCCACRHIQKTTSKNINTTTMVRVSTVRVMIRIAVRVGIPGKMIRAKGMGRIATSPYWIYSHAEKYTFSTLLCCVCLHSPCIFTCGNMY